MSLVETAIGWLAPPLCVSCREEGSSLCAACSTSEVKPYGSRCWQCGLSSQNSKTCPKCLALGSPEYVWITTTYAGPVKELVRQYKFVHLRAAAAPMAQMMSDTFLGQYEAEAAPKDFLIVPIPTANSRKRERSFGHAELLARQISRNLKMRRTYALGRLGQERQVGSQRSIRLRQPRGNYYVRKPELISGRNMLLIDDVVTTGGTLIAATQALKNAGASQVCALIFAKRL